VIFHDGKELTCKDIKYTFDFIMDPANLSPFYSAFSSLKYIECLDPYTIKFILDSPYASFPFQLTRGIVPAHLGRMADFQESPVGSGPFRFVRWKKGELVYLESFENYGEKATNLKWIIFSIIPHTTTRLLEMKKGRIDLLQNSIPPYAVNYFKQMRGINMIIEPGINYKYIGYNLRDPILGKKKVRQAISFAIDRDSIIKYTLKGLATKARGILSPLHWAYEGNVASYDYNPEKAKSLLDDAGFKDPDGDGPMPRFRLCLKTSTNRESKEIAEVIANQLRKVGISIDRRGYEWGTFYGDIKKGNFQMYTLNWVGIYDPDIFHYVFHSRMIPPIGANRGYYSNPCTSPRLDRTPS
jgi:peptide/nickel transport system substrate-binding protein